MYRCYFEDTHQKPKYLHISRTFCMKHEVCVHVLR